MMESRCVSAREALARWFEFLDCSSLLWLDCFGQQFATPRLKKNRSRNANLNIIQ